MSQICAGVSIIKNGRITSPGSQEKGIPMLVASNSFSGNVQFECDVTIEKTGYQSSSPFIREVSLVLYMPSENKGVTLGFGAEGQGGMIYEKGILAEQEIPAFYQYYHRLRPQQSNVTYSGDSIEVAEQQRCHIRIDRKKRGGGAQDVSGRP